MTALVNEHPPAVSRHLVRWRRPSAATACGGARDEVRYSMMPILIGGGVSFFGDLIRICPLHLLESHGYQNGMIALRYAVRSRTHSSAHRMLCPRREAGQHSL